MTCKERFLRYISVYTTSSEESQESPSTERQKDLTGLLLREMEELVGKTCIAITNLPPRAMMGIESCGMLISAVHHEGEEEKLHLLMVDPHIPAGAKLY